MVEPISFYIGVLSGQGSFVIAFILAKLTKHLVQKEQKFTSSEKKKDQTLCPKCESKKIAYTQVPGLLWCQSCGNEFKNGNPTATKQTKASKSIASK